MDFPLPLTLVLMLDDEDGAAPESGRRSASDDAGGGRASGVFSSNDRDEDSLGLSERVA